MTQPPDIVIEVGDTQTHLTVDRARVAQVARQVLEMQAVRRAEVSIVLVDDATIRRVNREHLGHDWETDIVTFPLSEPGEPLLVAELVISAEMAATTARAAGSDPFAELMLYVVHGLLHLTGHDDLDAADRPAMRRREAEILTALGLPNTFDTIAPGGRPEPTETPPCSV
jgi:probable rRNA maturation factor